HLLTIMCASTRFPEAIPLRNIKAHNIVKALVKFFTLVGLPKAVQSDQGSNFMSGIFQQVMYQLQIKQYKSRRKKTQLCHVNMLKKYVDREESKTSQPIATLASVPSQSE
ncbi:hypothetical protein ScPMuIL_005193, partial [Solemya velum]